MNPSSSSNADTPAGPIFRVTTRALAGDLSAACVDESARDLGAVDAPCLLALLEKLAALAATEVAEADPHLVVAARRGRFTIRPARNRFLVRSATDGAQGYLELSAAEVPEFLEGRDVRPAVPAEAPVPLAPPPQAETRLVLAMALFGLAVLSVAVSVWVTFFRSEQVDPDSDYVVIAAPAEVAGIRQQAAGLYACGVGDDERTLELSPAGNARYREYGPDRALTDEREGRYAIARRRSDQRTVLRVEGLGPIEVSDSATLVFARDTYQRRSGAEPPAR
jgi:hypothetical protein